MYDHAPRPPIATTQLSLVLTVPGAPADAALALQEWVGYLNGSGLEYELLLVSESGQSVEVIAAPFARVRPLPPPERQGFGAALGTAIPQALHPLLFYARCDLCYRPSDVKQLLSAIGTVDLVVGQRLFPPEAPHGGLREWLYRLFIRTMFGVRLDDLGCLFLLARRAAFARIPLQSRGLFAHTEILAKANFLGCYFSDVRVPYRPAVAPAHPGDDRWWSDARRVIAHPDFGPPHLPEPALPTA